MTFCLELLPESLGTILQERKSQRSPSCARNLPTGKMVNRVSLCFHVIDLEKCVFLAFKQLYLLHVYS